MKDRDKYLFAPTDLLKKYPSTPFTETDLGRLLRLNLLEGDCRKRETLIEEKSFVRLIQYMNTVIEKKLVPIK